MNRFTKSPLLGGVLIITGTTLGVGMLAFPTVTSFGGFFPSAILFIAVWLLLLSSSFFFLDANLAIPGQNNMVSMAEKLLGTWGKVVSWVVYLLLLYSLSAAYIAGCSPLFAEAIQLATGHPLPSWIAPFCLPLLFGGFVYAGTSGVDLVNRILMVGLIISYFLLICFLPKEVHLSRLTHVDFPATAIAIPVVITAFGYHIVIPSLATYMGRDRKQLRKAIYIGSFIPILVYLVWQVLVLGVVPFPLLLEAYQRGISATQPLALLLHNPLIRLSAKFFSFFAIVTSFIGVTLSLADFLSDGLKIKKNGKGRLLAMLLTFAPPLLFVFTYQRGFYVALQYAGAFVAILLVFLPAAMVWNLEKYRTLPKRLFLALVMLLSLAVIYLDVLEEGGKLQRLITQYTQKHV